MAMLTKQRQCPYNKALYHEFTTAQKELAGKKDEKKGKEGKKKREERKREREQASKINGRFFLLVAKTLGMFLSNVLGSPNQKTKQ